MTIPGLLIMLIFKVQKINFWEYLVYVIGLSIAFIMFAGLAINWILPWLNITDKPLSLIPVLVSFDAFILVLMTVASKRNPKLKFKTNFPKFSWLDRIFIIVPMIFPVISILGALTLNNFGPNYLTMIMLGSIAVYVFLVVLLSDKLNENVFPWALLMIGVSLLLMFSMRSSYVFGFDIHHELSILNQTVGSQKWNFSNYVDGYNACLSITILPAIL
ncbi:MAG: hypothetical protein ABIH72_00470, partial [archaeon]